MTTRDRDTKAILAIIKRGELRSPLFWWMVENHDAMLASADGQHIHWATFCGEAARRGLTDTKGRPPTERNARETWRQARLSVTDARRRQAETSATNSARPGAKYPSRISPDWRPQLAAGPVAASLPNPGAANGGALGGQGAGSLVLVQPVQPPVPPPPARHLSRFATADDSPQVQAMLAQVEAQLDKADLHLGPPLKKREQ